MGDVKRLAFVALLLAICLPGLFGAHAWLENSDVDRYAEMVRGWSVEAPFRFRPLVPWIASGLAFDALTSLRLVSLVSTLGAFFCVDRIVAKLGGDRVRAALLFVVSFPVAAYGASGYIDASVLFVLATGTWAVVSEAWLALALVVAVGSAVSEKTIVLLAITAAARTSWRRLLLAVGMYVAVQLAVRQGATTAWWPGKEYVRGNLSPGRWVRIALSFGVPAMLALPRLRGAPRPFVVGFAAIVAMIGYGIFAARVDGRFAWLAVPFAIPIAALRPSRSRSR
jgi:hypothetical protein